MKMSYKFFTMLIQKLWHPVIFSLGFIFALGAPLFTYAQEDPPACSTPWECGLANAGSAGLPEGSIYNIISASLSWLLAILGFIAIIAFVISGILYLTSAGNEGQAEQAKNAMKYAIIGVIVSLIGYVVVQAVDTFLMANPIF